MLQMVSEPDTRRCASKDADLQRGWIVRSHIGWRGERNVPLKGVETSPKHTCFKTVRLTTIHIKPKRTISTSNELGLLE